MLHVKLGHFKVKLQNVLYHHFIKARRWFNIFKRVLILNR